MKNKNNTSYNELDNLCVLVREHVSEREYDDCLFAIRKAMEKHPHAPQPHNLMGIVLEYTGEHLIAMKHFRAALALDPLYKPATHNLNKYGAYLSNVNCAFDDSDIKPQSNIEIVLNKLHISQKKQNNRNKGV